MRYTCGGCLLPYNSHSEVGPSKSVCPRCNPGKTLNTPIIELTPRESEIVNLLVTGVDNRAIGQALGTGEQVVKNHLVVVYRKMGCKSRLQCAIIWVGLTTGKDKEIRELREQLADRDRELMKWRRRLG